MYLCVLEKITTLRAWYVSTGSAFVHVDYSSKSRSCVQRFDSFKANEIELNVTNLEIARLCRFVFERKILS